MNIYPFKASFPNIDLIASPESFFETVSNEFPNFMNSGFFTSMNEEAIFIYRIYGKRSFTGIIASSALSDIEDKKILGHEHTINEKEQAMMQLMLLRKAMIKPVLLAYEEKQEINGFVENYIKNRVPFFVMDLSVQNEKHSLWDVTDRIQIEEIQHLFNNYVKKSYIADGHHRASVTAKLVRKKYLHDDSAHPGLLSVFFPFRDLEILDYNRIVNLSLKMSKVKFLAFLSSVMDIEPLKTASKPTKKHEITMQLDHEWYLLKWKEKVFLSVSDNKVVLDVDLFNQFILQDILHIHDIKTTSDVMYVEGVLGLEDLEERIRKNNDYIGFCLYPVTKEDVIRISDDGGVLPPKSTWFEPRMKNGLIVKKF
ncbi:MAG: DUF1015 domain-containing protein [Saprospiraceae bacterium]|nr:DUF1015 domain-containing protein [Saprospiraceae bacterium]